MNRCMIVSKINNFLGEMFNLGIVKNFPRHSIRFAIKHFNNIPITVVEIGTYKGLNAENLFKNLNIKKLYIIDPYEEYEDYIKSESKQTQKQLSKVESTAKDRLDKYSDRIIWIKKYSDEALKDIKEEIDFVYIDGNHEYKYVKKDIENYYPIIKENGIIAGHDISCFTGVSEAVIEFSYENKVKPHITRTDFWWVKTATINNANNSHPYIKGNKIEARGDASPSVQDASKNGGNDEE